MRSSAIISTILACCVVLPHVGGKREVGIGVYVLNVADENIDGGVFYADALIYLRADGTPYKDWTPNVVNGGQFVQVANFSDHYRIKSKFYFNVDLRDWPFDEQALELIFEDELKNSQELSFTPIPQLTGLSDSIRFPGWTYTSVRYTYAVTEKVYPSKEFLGTNDTYSRYAMRIHVERPFLKVFMTTFLPPLFILLVVLYSWSLSPQNATTRIQVCGSMLLSAVLFHVNINQRTPPTGYLSFVDRFLVCVYFIIIVSFLWAILVMKLHFGSHTAKAEIMSNYGEWFAWGVLPGIFIALNGTWTRAGLTMVGLAGVMVFLRRFMCKTRVAREHLSLQLARIDRTEEVTLLASDEE